MTDINKQTDFMKGSVLMIDKPFEWSSFDVVNKVRILLQKKFRYKWLKVGHAGTLDPLATGLLILCTGNSTREITSFLSMEKEYIATICLGKSSPSFDLETQPDQIYPTEHITLELILKILPQFIGSINQVPPIFSAKRVKGKRAYEFARKGKEIELKANTVFIREIELIEFNNPVIVLRIKCGKGTYIRSLARDIGKALNSGAHLIALKRISIGDYKISEALTMKKFEEKIKLM